MKTIALLAFALLLPACTADVFAASDDAGPTADAATNQDATPDTDADVDTDAAPTADSGTDSPTQDADAAVKDAATDSAVEPVCAPLGFKPCAAPNSKCEVLDSAGTAKCVVPGSTPLQTGCTKDDDCGKDAICSVSVCRSLCQKTYQTPWGVNANMWPVQNCAVCPGGWSSPLQMPSWIGVCN